jgi:hypothetical protein
LYRYTLACAVALARHPGSRQHWLGHRGWGAAVEVGLALFTHVIVVRQNTSS